MFNPQYEEEYERSIRDLKKTFEEYKPFFENRKQLLTDEEIAASERLTKAQKSWIEARKKYFGEP